MPSTAPASMRAAGRSPTRAQEIPAKVNGEIAMIEAATPLGSNCAAR